MLLDQHLVKKIIFKFSYAIKDSWFTINERCMYASGQRCFVTIKIINRNVCSRCGYSKENLWIRLITSNEEMEDIMKIVKSVGESGLIIKGISETIKDETKEQKGGFFCNFIRNIFTEKTSFIWWTSTSSSMAMKIICSHNITEILFTLKILKQTCFCLVSEKNLQKWCSTISWRPGTATILETLWRQMSVCFCISPYKTFCSREVARSGEAEGGWGVAE